ncbi:hypothetical protein J7L01_00215, partial [bacterium]|nr:hypothetical protein [bacterium]
MKSSLILFCVIILFSSLMAAIPLFDESGGLIIPDFSSDTAAYAEWKASLFRTSDDGVPRDRPASPMDWRPANGFVRADVDETSGEFDEGADPSGGGSYVRLTYSFPDSPGTEWVMYYVDGFTGKTASGLPNTSSNYMSGGTAYSIWNNWHGVYIRQEISAVSLGGSPGDNEQIKFKTVMKPADGACHDVGCIVYYDTMLNGRDGAEISTSYGYTGVTEIFYAPDIPPTWRAYEHG